MRCEGWRYEEEEEEAGEVMVSIEEMNSTRETMNLGAT